MISKIYLTILLVSLPYLRAIDYTLNGVGWETQSGSSCGGNQQSPINIVTSSVKCDPTSYLKADFFNSVSTTVSDNGETVKGVPSASNGFDTLTAIDVNGNIYGYSAVNFHFHAPSEHTINGKLYDLELHIVHSMLPQYTSIGSTTRSYAVLGFLFQLDNSAPDNPFLTALTLDNVNQATSQTVNLDVKNLIGNNLPSPLTYYKYLGSLTTPPCSELVNWYLVTTPLKINSAQLVKLTNRWAGNTTFANGKGNNRAVQNLNGRVVELGGATCSAEKIISFIGLTIISLLAIYM